MKRRKKPPSSEEQHDFKYRGTLVPPEVMHLLSDGKIDTTEFTLLSVIDSLVDSKGEGCWASNAYLGWMLDRHPDQISRIIQSLKKQGLLRQVGVVKKY